MPAERGAFDVGGLHQVQARTPGQATPATDNTWTLFVAPCALELTAITETYDAAITGAATDYFTHEYRNEGLAGTGTTVMTVQQDFDDDLDAVAHVPLAVALSATVASRRLAVGEVLSLVRATPGDGLAEPAALITIQFKPL